MSIENALKRLEDKRRSIAGGPSKDAEDWSRTHAIDEAIQICIEEAAKASEQQVDSGYDIDDLVEMLEVGAALSEKCSKSTHLGSGSCNKCRFEEMAIYFKAYPPKRESDGHETGFGSIQPPVNTRHGRDD